MNSAIIVCTHGNAAMEMLKTAEMIMGKQENILPTNFVPGENTADLIKKYHLLCEQLDCTNGVLIMVDLLGGSPFNAASQIALQNRHIEVITGVNIPMLLETLITRNSKTLQQLLEISIAAGKNGISKLNKNNIEKDDLEGDEL
ncbi:mannose/fructose/sorbose PTS transporter subunit IIA [Virgibacillus sp. Bac330]|uniref:mannose/fructose/sorbose PTS transporter subunit IIA n=1 Tax=Virgibacillus sp. Bac330 TaxID=2419841 RepID=UPI0013CEA5F8|nr:mannose/fructose/sorbose PTS transporter subunit IIA [Virgibacillus sp. Bac330]